MQERVFAPLGMQRTLWRGEDVLADGNYTFGLTSDASGGLRESSVRERLVTGPLHD